jgi:hypothetical protein
VKEETTVERGDLRSNIDGERSPAVWKGERLRENEEREDESAGLRSSNLHALSIDCKYTGW